MAGIPPMKIEVSQDAKRIANHLTNAIEGLTKALQTHKGDVTMYYADNQPYLIRGDEDGFLEPVLHAKIDEEGACIQHNGVNYYRSCGEVVTEYTDDDNQGSLCVLPKGHEGLRHVDWDGHEREITPDA